MGLGASKAGSEAPDEFVGTWRSITPVALVTITKAGYIGLVSDTAIIGWPTVRTRISKSDDAEITFEPTLIGGTGWSASKCEVQGSYCWTTTSAELEVHDLNLRFTSMGISIDLVKDTDTPAGKLIIQASDPRKLISNGGLALPEEIVLERLE